MGLAEIFELVGVIAGTLVLILAVYVGLAVYKREKKFAAPKRRRRKMEHDGETASPNQRRAK